MQFVVQTWDKVETLQNEVELVSVTPTHFYVLSFWGLSVICGVLILSYERLMN